jgi:hypothetical protein
VSKVTLVYEGPGQHINLDVAAAPGDGRLEPGREIEVEKELAELLEASSPYWTRAGAKKDTAAKAGSEEG